MQLIASQDTCGFEEMQLPIHGETETEILTHTIDISEAQEVHPVALAVIIRVIGAMKIRKMFMQPTPTLTTNISDLISLFSPTSTTPLKSRSSLSLLMSLTNKELSMSPETPVLLHPWLHGCSTPKKLMGRACAETTAWTMS